MRQADTISLIARGITGSQPQTWAELGSGSGTFTLALKSLLSEGSVLKYAVCHQGAPALAWLGPMIAE